MRDKSQVHKLLRIANGASSSLIVIQDIPDPDAIASGEALKKILDEKCGIESTIAHEGMVGRAENRGLLRYLGLKLEQISTLAPADFDLVATVDTQPQFGNNSLPPDTPCHIVIDHHHSDEPPAARFVDVRPSYGATSTILTQYLRQCGISADIRLATALLYGIRSDTQDLGRESTPADTEAYLFLYPQVNKTALSRIEHEGVPRAYFVSLHKALEESRVYGRALICFAGGSCVPEIVAELADLMQRLGEVDYVLCYGVCKDRITVSLRVGRRCGSAHKLMSEIVKGIGSGGGHETFAGGQIPLMRTTPEEAGSILEERFLASLNQSGTKPTRLVPANKQREEGKWSMTSCCGD